MKTMTIDVRTVKSYLFFHTEKLNGHAWEAISCVLASDQQPEQMRHDITPDIFIVTLKALFPFATTIFWGLSLNLAPMILSSQNEFIRKI